MTTFTFDAEAEDGSPRVFAGMWRPPSLAAIADRIDEWIRQTYRPSYTPEDLRRAWQDGAFDRPLYVLEEAPSS